MKYTNRILHNSILPPLSFYATADFVVIERSRVDAISSQEAYLLYLIPHPKLQHMITPQGLNAVNRGASALFNLIFSSATRNLFLNSANLRQQISSACLNTISAWGTSPLLYMSMLIPEVLESDNLAEKLLRQV